MGAHIGRYVISIAKRLKKGKVIAIEPGPVISKKNVALNNLTNVILLNIAALDKDGEASLY